jgi:hypothetical protein
MFPAILPPPCRPTARKSPRVAMSRFLSSLVMHGRLAPAFACASSTACLCPTSSFSLPYALFCINIKIKTLYPHCFHTFAHSTFWNIFTFNELRTLFKKHGGGGLLFPFWNPSPSASPGFLRSLPFNCRLLAVSSTSAPSVGPYESSESSVLAISGPAELEWCADAKTKDRPCR